MARVPLTVLLVCTLLLQYAACHRDYDSHKPKKNRDQELQLGGPEDLNNNGVRLADSEEKIAEKLRWHQKIEEKKRRLAEKEQRKRNSRRQERDLERTFEIQGPSPTSTEVPDPPSRNKYAEVARFIVHNSDWATGGYISHHPGKEGLPMTTLISVSDGLLNASTGIPYMYVSPFNAAVQDFSLRNGTEEWNFASSFYFDRHPGMRNMPIGHKFHFAKFKIAEIALQDYFGGLKHPSLKEYFAVKLTNETEQNLSWN